ncbi:helix-turn-helix domain-containing protein [Streptomyces kronopolitis]|uniref:helix-turn-helix domain-containing protein n=1 Tax=Streptomyces kronopolitis TaxID=1612435 RepID=UPI0035715FA1
MEAVAMFAEGRGSADIAKELRVSVRSVQRWRRALSQNHNCSIKPHRPPPRPRHRARRPRERPSSRQLTVECPRQNRNRTIVVTVTRINGDRARLHLCGPPLNGSGRAGAPVDRLLAGFGRYSFAVNTTEFRGSSRCRSEGLPWRRTHWLAVSRTRPRSESSRRV